MIISHTTEKTTDAIAMKFYPDTILLSHIYGFEGYSSRYKIDGWWTIIQIAVNSSNLKKIWANIAQDDLQYLVIPTS